MFSRQRRIWSFHVAVLKSMTKKCTKNYNVHAELLLMFRSLNLLFDDVLGVIAVLFCVSKHCESEKSFKSP